MGWRSPPLLAFCCWLLLVGYAPAQTYNSAEYVRGLYHKYLDREPSSNELTQWIWSFQKGLSLAEAQATFLSSDEFYSRCGRNPELFVTSLYTEILNRMPSANERSEWARNLSVVKGDRAKLVRQFLEAAQRETSAATALPTGQPRQRESQLVATARLLQNSLAEETGGTHAGRQLAIMSRNLTNASRNLQRASQGPNATYNTALSDVQAALNALANEMRPWYATVPTSTAYLQQYEQVFRSLGGTESRPTTRPSIDRPPVDGISSQLYYSLVQVSTTLLGDTNQVVYLLRNTAGQNSTANQLLRDVEFFSAQATALHQSLREGLSRSELRHTILRLRALSQGVSRSMQETGQMGWVFQRWQIVAQDMQQLGELVGVSSGPTIDPGQPVLLNSPTYYQLPYQVQRPTAVQVSSQATALTDQAIAHVDAFVAGFNQFLHLSPRVPALQAQARAMRMSLAQLRQELANGSALPS